MSDTSRKPDGTKPVFEADADQLNADWLRRLVRQRRSYSPEELEELKKLSEAGRKAVKRMQHELEQSKQDDTTTNDTKTEGST